MKKLFKIIPIFLLITIVPMVAFAASTCTATNGLGLVICKISDLLGTVLPVLVAFGVLYFIWGVITYIIADGEEAKKTGKDRIIYGIIGFTAIVSVWGLVDIIVKTFGLGGAATPSLVPLTGTAATCNLLNNPKIQDLLCYVTGIINSSIIPLIFAVAVVTFAWGVVKFFIIDANEEKKREEGKQFMIWGIIALTIMLSIWGLVAILGDTFNVGSKVLPQVTPPGSSSSGGFMGPCPAN